MKKSCLIGLLICLLAVPAWGHPPIRVYVDGTPVVFSDQAPVIVEERTLVPMRRIFEAMDATVSWSEPTQTITAVRNSDTVKMVIGKKEVLRNDQVVYTMDVPAQIMQDRTMVPIRAVAKAFDANIQWDGVNYIIDITSPTQSALPSENSYHKEVFAEDGTLLLTVDYSYAPLKANTASAKRINDHFRQKVQDKGKEYTAQYTEIAQALYDAAKKADQPFSPCYAMGVYEVSAETADLASIVLRERSFTGEDEEVSVSSWLYSLHTGNTTTLADVVADSEQELQTLMQKGFDTLIDANPQGFFADAKKRLSAHPEYIHTYIEKNQIVCYINPGMIADTHAGVIAYAIAYSI